ncbi:MAG: enoyl-CoA hydratase/isomerase family protein [Pseudomonadota bacterium]
MAHLEIEHHKGIATVTFDNPPLSVMTARTIQELHELLPELEADAVRAVVLTGSGEEYFVRHFSVEELDESAQGDGPAWEVNMDDVLLRLEHLPKPVIAALNGTALGGGLELALATDTRVAKDGAYRFGLPEISVGILPGGGGTQRLSALLGRHKALQMMWRAQLLTPQQALEHGLIDEMVDADTTERAVDRAQSIAAEIAARPALAVAHIKHLARHAANPVSREMLGEESRRFAELMRTPEAKALLAAVASDHRAERGG